MTRTGPAGDLTGVAADEPLTWPQRRFLLLLGMPAFGIALAYTVVTTYVPVLLSQLSGPAVTGILIGGEGVLALLVPVLVGGWSDQLRTRLGGRLPFVLGGAVLAVAALVLMPLGAGSLVWVAIALGVFYVAYFIYYAPYYALYPDLVPAEARGRSQGFQGSLRSAGLLVALAGGGSLLSFWQPLPFVVGAVAIVLVTAALVVGVRGRLGLGEGAPARENGFTTILRLMREDRRIRRWAVANACWEGAIAALRTFVVLYFTVGLGFSLHATSGALALVGMAALLAAPVAGKLSDRYGPLPVMHIAIWVFTIGLVPALLTTNAAYLAAVVPVAFAAVILMTLPYSVLMGLLPDGEHGTGASLFGVSRGVGVIVGPLFAGVATQFLSGVPFGSLDDTRGYAAIFGVAAVLLLASLPFLTRID